MRALVGPCVLTLIPLASACGGHVVLDTGGAGGGGTQSSSSGATFACTADSDCESRPSGCCGVCANLTDPVPPPMDCGVPCPAPLPCLCNLGQCVAGAAH